MAWHPAWNKTLGVLKIAQKQATPAMRALLQSVINAMEMPRSEPEAVDLAASTLALGDLAADLLRQVERLQAQVRTAQATEAKLRKELAEVTSALDALARLRSTAAPTPDAPPRPSPAGGWRVITDAQGRRRPPDKE